MGLFIGASLLAPLADRLGRRLTFMFALAWYGIFSLIMALQNSAEGVIFFRFWWDRPGIELVTIDTYLSEWMPTHLRNKAFAYAFFIQFLSVPTVALMSATGANDHSRPERLALGDYSRRTVFTGHLGYPQKLPESARWLESKGRHDDAHRVMGEMEQRCGLSPSRRHASQAVAVPQRSNFKEIWAPQYRQRTLMLMVMNFSGHRLLWFR